MARPIPLLASLPLALVSLAQASAQAPGGLWQYPRICAGTTPGYFTPSPYLGWTIADMGDLDGDGLPDFAVGIPRARRTALHFGAVVLYSGATGAEIRRHDGPSDWSEFGDTIANAGDVDGDGVADLLVGAHAQYAGLGALHLYSGATGQLLHHIRGRPGMPMRLGAAVAGIGDIDGDGYDDVAATASSGFPAGPDPEIRIYSGATGDLLRRIDSATSPGLFGTSLAALGDIDADGVTDLIAGDPSWDSNAGQVMVYSGTTGAVLIRVTGTAPNWDHLGEKIAVLPDVDGDGVPDFAANCRGPVVVTPYGNAAYGAIRVYSGRTGALLRELTSGIVSGEFGRVFAPVGDVNGDGLEDLVAFGRGTTYRPGYEVHSIADGRLLWRYDDIAPDASASDPISKLGDVDGDGIPEFLASAATIGGDGAIHRMGYKPFLEASSSSLSLGAGASIAFHLQFPISEAGRRFVLLASRSHDTPTMIGGVAVPLELDGLLSSLLSGRAPNALAGSRGLLDGQARATATLTPTPAMAPLVGTTLYFAALTFDPLTYSGRLSSGARAVMVTP